MMYAAHVNYKPSDDTRNHYWLLSLRDMIRIR